MTLAGHTYKDGALFQTHKTYSLSGRLHPCIKNKYYTYLHIHHAMSYNTLLYLKYRMALGIAKATDSWECLQNVSVVWSTTWYLSGDTTQMQHLLTASCHRALQRLPAWSLWTRLQLPANTFNLTGVTKHLNSVHKRTPTIATYIPRP